MLNSFEQARLCKMDFLIDEYGNELMLRDDQHQVMMEWEKPYMKACIDQLQPKGHVLEIGFGMGYSATQIQSYKPKSHTIVECHPVAIEKAKKWAEQYQNITIVENTWQEALLGLGEFDEIFFDDYPILTEDNEFELRTYRH